MDANSGTRSGLEKSGGRTTDTPAHLVVERNVIGANVGANGYTTIAQADDLIRLLRLRPEERLLDIGAGRGWPGLYLAEKTRCVAALLEISEADLRTSIVRAESTGTDNRCSFIRGTASALPFRSRSFDALVHTDVL